MACQMGIGLYKVHHMTSFASQRPATSKTEATRIGTGTITQATKKLKNTDWENHFLLHLPLLLVSLANLWWLSYVFMWLILFF